MSCEQNFLIPTRRDLQPDRDFLAERYEIFRKAGGRGEAYGASSSP